MKEEMQRAVGRVARVQAAATRWPFYVFMGGSMFCLLSSAVCHLFTCHSQGLAILLMRVDYAGIATMIATSFYPPIYYVFQCEPVWQFIYLGTITAMGVASVGVLFAPALQSSKYRVFRTVLFMSMGLFGVFPAIHGVITNWNEPQCHATIAYEASMAAFYVLGGIIYAVRIPERWRPGWFDLACHSHSLFHIFVVAGAVAHYQAALLFIEWRDAKGCH
jgi:channel protein (hemolysin III family)